jgi:hypothetical protein
MSGKAFRLLYVTTAIALAACLLVIAAASSTVQARLHEKHLSLLAAQPVAGVPLKPFDPAPTMTFPTTRGDLTIGAGMPDTESYILIGHNTLSSASEAIWASSVVSLTTTSPPDVNYVFMSYADTPEAVQADIAAMQARADAAIAQMPDDADRQHWVSHLHYVTQNPLTLGDPVATVLRDWGAVVADVTAGWQTATGPQQVNTRGTTDSGWAKSLAATGPITAPVGLYGNLACGTDTPVQNLQGKMALIERGTCTFTEKVANAEKNGAIAAIIYTDDRPILQMGGTCSPCPQIPVTMIDRQPGLDMRAQLEAANPVAATMAPIKLGADTMAVDHQARVRELGTIPFPFDLSPDPQPDNFNLVAKEATYYHYEHERDTRLKEEEAAGDTKVLPLLQGVWAADPNWAGVKSYADVDLPDASAMTGYDTLEVELALGCQDHRKANCPAWDYIVDLWLCDQDNPDKCDTLAGRWITPYWAEGHWVTDITPILGYLANGGHRRFAFYTQQRYQVDLSLRLTNQGKGLVPKWTSDLRLNGGPFNQKYNQLFPPIEFVMPDWADKVEVASFITGHGWGVEKANCAEFCDHTHHFTINGQREHAMDNPLAGTLMGCADQVPDGVVPNQGGTWIYGRGGWCPGLDVRPWVFDATGDVTKATPNRLSYRGLYDGQDYVPEPSDDPNAQGFAANIAMRSYLVYWARPEVQASPVPAPRWDIHGTIYLPYASSGDVLIPLPTPTPTPKPCLVQEIEPNDTSAEAELILESCPDRTVAGALPDSDPRDLFPITLDNAGRLVVDLDLRLTPPGTNFDLAVWLPGMTQLLAYSPNGGSTPERIELDVPAGQYLIEVHPATGTLRSDGLYRLTWRLQ